MRKIHAEVSLEEYLHVRDFCGETITKTIRRLIQAHMRLCRRVERTRIMNKRKGKGNCPPPLT